MPVSIVILYVYMCCTTVCVAQMQKGYNTATIDAFH